MMCLPTGRSSSFSRCMLSTATSGPTETIVALWRSYSEVILYDTPCPALRFMCLLCCAAGLQKRPDHLGVELRVRVPLELVHRDRMTQRLPVRPRRCHGVIGIGHLQHPDDEGDRVSPEPVGI